MSHASWRLRLDPGVLEDLVARLAATRLPEAESGSALGISLDFMRRVLRHWREEYDWGAAMERLNAGHQYRMALDGLATHFVWERGRGRRPLPLLLTHGWPGSYLEFRKVIPLLADPGAHGGDPADDFDVIVPSLPGYGFSSYPNVGGMTPRDVARRWGALMTALGYETYGLQGGDWGAAVASWLALTEPRRVAGLHLNYIPGSYHPNLEGEPPLREDERGFLRDADRWYAEEGGYHHQQSTMPLTLGYGLTDSPVGLAAWILEKVERWSDCDRNLETRFTLDELLDNVMVYWISGTGYSAGRLYAEAATDPFSLGPGERVERPTGVLRLAKEAPFPPRSYVERGYRVVRWTEVDRGGHFAAWEEPEAFVADVRAFFRPLRP